MSRAAGAPDGWLTLRELDQAAGRPKGSAFRAFKVAALAEGSDFVVLEAEADATAIAALRTAGRSYRSSRSVVLVSPAAAARLQRALL